ncbi:MAG: hypothetical protein ABFD54_04075 [Armatimonadota bacterium]|nr:hypothetical protein [bacterium]
MMKLIVFNVEQGQCVYVRTPNDCGILIDCGRSRNGDTASPTEWLAKNEGDELAAMIVTHPHDHHLEDIDTVMRLLPPAVLIRDADYDWEAVLSQTTGADDNIRAYHEWESNFVNPAIPDFGAEVRTFSLSRQKAEQLGGDLQHQMNNRSIVTVISYKSTEGYAWKVVIAGDNETDGWQALLEKPEFKSAIKETDFFVTSRHGKESGFCAELFKAMGKPMANITSTRVGDQRVDPRYKKSAQGVKFPDGSRTHFETRDDGNITIQMNDDGRYDVWLFQP